MSFGDIIQQHSSAPRPSNTHAIHFNQAIALSAAATVSLVEANTLVLDKSGISTLLVDSLIGGSVGRVTESHGFDCL
jgi:hypothetical protein